nr:Receptor expression-enhancing protein 1 [Polyrhizophydium stewartii]
MRHAASRLLRAPPARTDGDRNVVGLLLPAYTSYKAVKAEDEEQIQQWAKYWIVMALFAVAESITDTVLFWLPLYYESKLLFVLWLSLPYTQGATILYESQIRPLLEQKEPEIERGIARSKSVIKRASVEWSRKGIFMLQQAFLSTLMSPEIDPEFSEVKIRRKETNRRLERRLAKLSEAELPIESNDAALWIKKEKHPGEFAPDGYEPRLRQPSRSNPGPQPNYLGRPSQDRT